MRHLLPVGIVALAELRAAEIGVGADRVLIAQGYIDEETYLRELARELGCGFESLHDSARRACPFKDDEMIEAARTGMLPLNEDDGELTIVLAPGELTARRLVERNRAGSDVATRVRLTSNARLARFVRRHASGAIGWIAAERLRDHRPQMSAGTGRSHTVMAAVASAAIALFALLAPGMAGYAMEIMLGAVFFAWTALRLIGMLSTPPIHAVPRPVPDHRLPIYTVVVALYREAAAAKDLVAALRNFDYPPERLDIKLVLEPDDLETRVALEVMTLTAPFEIVVAPATGPKTKPKALNAVLPFARGSFIAIYDAEDRPEPDQLRLALEAFTAGDEGLACVQARLTIDNTSDSWLTRLFTAEYAGLFDVFLPGLAASRLPLPLGGSSNHFRTSILRDIDAWDPYNVTEDADLGMRLARRGYHTDVIPSTTYEEAPARLGPWLKQRTRWSKGWIQTWLVHMRSPRQLQRDLRWPGFAVFQLMVGGTVIAALVHSLFVGDLLIEFADAAFAQDAAAFVAVGLHAIPLFAGYAVSIAIGLIGLWRRGLARYGWILVLIPIYWVLLSIAAWRAIFQIARDPYRWEKTEHGLARSSRLAQTPCEVVAFRDNGASRPRLRQGAASY